MFDSPNLRGRVFAEMKPALLQQTAHEADGSAGSELATNSYTPTDELSPKQGIAISALVIGLSDRVAAEHAGVHRVTLTRWPLYDEPFRAAYIERLASIWTDAAEHLCRRPSIPCTTCSNAATIEPVCELLPDARDRREPPSVLPRIGRRIGSWRPQIKQETPFPWWKRGLKRRGRDSNPRYRHYQYDGLANRWFQPLTHLSRGGVPEGHKHLDFYFGNRAGMPGPSYPTATA